MATGVFLFLSCDDDDYDHYRIELLNGLKFFLVLFQFSFLGEWKGGESEVEPKEKSLFMDGQTDRRMY